MNGNEDRGLRGPGEVLATKEILDASSRARVSFTPIGTVELKGVSGVVELCAARDGR